MSNVSSRFRLLDVCGVFQERSSDRRDPFSSWRANFTGVLSVCLYRFDHYAFAREFEEELLLWGEASSEMGMKYLKED